MTANKLPSTEELNQLFYIKNDALYWLENRSNKVKKHMVAGCLSKTTGYILIGLNHRLYLAHRIIWKMHHKKDPPKDIDHIDGNRANNNINNLRSVNQSENSKNATISKNNTSGVTGVSFHKNSKKWRAEIKVSGRAIHLGYYKTKAQAAQSRRKAESEYGFHKNHGKKNAPHDQKHKEAGGKSIHRD